MQIAVDSKYSVSKGKEYWVKERALAVSKSLSKMIQLIKEIIHVEPKKHFVVCRSGLGMQYGLGR
jgi:hypothetical protein